MNKVEKKRIKEQQTIEKMIHLYCKKNHHTSKLCPECQELLDYAKARSRRCPFMEEKTFCAVKPQTLPIIETNKTAN